MNTSALVMMIVTNLVVLGFSAYFFYKVYSTPLKDVDEDDAPFPRGG